jgi:hypothetical protein
VARLTMRKVPLGIEFARSEDTVASGDGAANTRAANIRAANAGAANAGAASTGAGSARAGKAAGTPEFRMTVRRGTPVVTVIGPPAELTLWATGRTAAANVRLDGTEAAAAMLSQARWRI